MVITRRWTIRAAASVLVLGAVIAVLWWAFLPPVLEVETAAATRGTFEEFIEDEARARVRERVAITLPWAGEIERPLLKEGQWVEPGEVLAWVRPVQPTLQDARTRGELQARGASAQSAWQLAQRQSEVALVGWQRAATSATRSLTLFEQGFVSRAQVEASVLDLQREERAWQAAQAAERVALHQLEQARMSLATFEGVYRGARRALRADRRVQVLRVLQPHAAVLPAGATLVEVGDVRRPEVLVPLLSQEALRLQPGAHARLFEWSAGAPSRREAGSSPERFVEGRVRMVEPAATTKVSALGLEEQRINVVVDPLADLPAGDGYGLRVRFILQTQPDALMVPVAAVFPYPGDPTRQGVFVVREHRARLVAVEVRARGSGQAWVAAGLAEGDRVVVYPPAAMADGSRVREVSGSR